MEHIAFTTRMSDSMRLSALFCPRGPEGQALRLVGYWDKGSGKYYVSGSWVGGTARATEKEFQYLSLLIGAVNSQGLPEGI